MKIYCTCTQETTRNNIEQAQECNLKHERLFNTFCFIYHSTFALDWKYVWICFVLPWKAFWSMLVSETEAGKVYELLDVQASSQPKWVLYTVSEVVQDDPRRNKVVWRLSNITLLHSGGNQWNLIGSLTHCSMFPVGCKLLRVSILLVFM